MNISVSKPEALWIQAGEAGEGYFGGDQEWYPERMQRLAGCGPTCAANITAYLAMTRPSLRALYGGEAMRLPLFCEHMVELYRYVTPGNMGLNRVEMYTQGMADYTASKGLALTAHSFEVSGNMARTRPSADEMAAFVRRGLESDCPIAFLNLTRGRVSNIQPWHWITLMAAEIDEGVLVAEASDEGKKIHFDLRLWYLSTRMRGGLVYFTEA